MSANQHKRGWVSNYGNHNNRRNTAWLFVKQSRRVLIASGTLLTFIMRMAFRHDSGRKGEFYAPHARRNRCPRVSCQPKP